MKIDILFWDEAPDSAPKHFGVSCSRKAAEALDGYYRALAEVARYEDRLMDWYPRPVHEATAEA